jgi:NADH:ubiquinone reductase (H+-translocating)
MALENGFSIHIPETAQKRVVVIGGGFAGIEFAKLLSDKDVQLVMFDRHNYHTFQPLLYQVATAGIEPDSVASPLRKLFDHKKNFYFRMALVNEIIPEENAIITSIGRLTYDLLVIAVGSKTNYFGNQDLLKKCFPLKQVTQALDLRSYILQNFEKAVLIKDPEDLEGLMNYAVVGGGPTGVELAGALAELKKHVLPRDYPELDFRQMNIYLVEGTGKLLGGMSDVSARKAKDFLEEMGVNVILNKLVKSYDGKQVYLNDGQTITTKTLVWAAGVKGNLIPGLREESIFQGHRIKVDEYSRVSGYDNIYALGDIAAMITPDFPQGHPMVAPVAMQQGRHLARNLNNLLKGKEQKPFKYFDKGTMATVGRNKAVVEMPNNMRVQGFFAWVIWMFVHLLFLIGFRSKLVVLMNWIWSYFTYDKGTRLIIRPYVKPNNPFPPVPIKSETALSGASQSVQG